MFGFLKSAGLGVQFGAALGSAALLTIAATLFARELHSIYRDGYGAGLDSAAVASAEAVQKAQEEFDIRTAVVDAEHQRRVRELENVLETTKRDAEAAARRDRAAFNAELVRLRNEARAERNASRAQDTPIP